MGRRTVADAPIEASGGVTRYNLVLPLKLKRALEVEAAREGLSGPELSRRLLSRGLEQLQEQVSWQEAERVTEANRARDREVVEWWEAWENAWERVDEPRARRHR